MTYNRKEYQKQYHIDNKEKHNEYSKQYYKDNRKRLLKYGRQYNKDNRRKIKQEILKRKYNLFYEDWLELWETQDGKCAICKKRFTKPSMAYVDHNHKTNKVRGLLCNKCNRGMGCFDDDPEMTARMTKHLLKETIKYE